MIRTLVWERCTEDVEHRRGLHDGLVELGAGVRCQMAGLPGWELGDLAAWADTLDEPTVEVWRTPCGERVLVSVVGCTADGVPVEVFDGLSYGESLFGTIPAATTRTASRVELAKAAARSASAPAEATR